GVRNLLRHADILKEVPLAQPTRWLAMPSSDCFHIAETEGLVEPCATLGQAVRSGDILARIHPIGRTGSAPAECRAVLHGMLAARHVPGLVKPGDCLAVIAVETVAPEGIDRATTRPARDPAQSPRTNRGETIR
ncbi:MAG TPA: succinylglutamate desuccinylase/aspartoacylase family protein, partial [Acetobacteraceae bacterium]|nr:succinylglutamate desuccinylase/aspartoacylase family protein [Acetobacteraceae bacterium]